MGETTTVVVRPVHRWVAECACGWRQHHVSEAITRWDADEHAHGHTDADYRVIVLTAGGEVTDAP